MWYLPTNPMSSEIRRLKMREIFIVFSVPPLRAKQSQSNSSNKNKNVNNIISVKKIPKTHFMINTYFVFSQMELKVIQVSTSQ